MWRRIVSLTEHILPGLTGGVVALVGAQVTRDVWGTAMFADIAADAATSILSTSAFSYLLERLGANAKPALFGGIVVAQLLIYLLVSLWAAVAVGGRGASSAPPTLVTIQHIWSFLAQALVAGGLFLGITIWLDATTEAELPERTGWARYTAVSLALSSLFALVAQGYCWLTDILRPRPVEGERPGMSRRRFLGLLISLALLAATSTFLASRVLEAGKAGVQRFLRGRPTPPVTPNSDFYIVSKNLIDPHVNLERWRLTVGGLTRRQLELSLDDVKALPTVEDFVTMQCISNEVGGELMSNALWKGVRLRDLLDLAGPLESAQFVAFECYDGYTESLPLEFAKDPKVRLVYEMNGEPLPAEHGRPLRLLAPGKYGIKHPKWLTTVVLLDQEFFGYWQRRDWTQEARMKTSSRIDVPASGAEVEDGLFRIRGVSFSGDRGISRVEVSTDGGANWNDATLVPPLSPYTWVLWHYDWRAEVGDAEIVARATDGTGEVQTDERSPPLPDGASGHPRVRVRVIPRRG